jgi:predicted TIM-barrel fold metal-dependent hydrolase
MACQLFDAQSGFGGASAGQTEIPSATELLSEMDRLKIVRALVRLVPETMDHDAVRSNEVLLAACRENSRLAPCPVVLPSGGGDLPEEAEQVAALVRRGAATVTIQPSRHHWSLAEWSSGKLFQALAARRLPVFCLERLVALEALAELAARHPQLPFILAETNYRQQRNLLALLSAFKNIHLSLGSNYTVHRGLEQLVRVVGPEQLLFGTGFPESEAAPAVTQFAYAEISAEQRTMIASGNLERLIGRIQR